MNRTQTPISSSDLDPSRGIFKQEYIHCMSNKSCLSSFNTYKLLVTYMPTLSIKHIKLMMINIKLICNVVFSSGDNVTFVRKTRFCYNGI